MKPQLNLGAGAAMKARTPSCSFDELKAADSLPIRLGDQLVCHVEPRRFSTGTYGLSFNGMAKISLPDGGVANCQCSMILVVIGSRDSDVDRPS
jgi:hypothetical protein